MTADTTTTLIFAAGVLIGYAISYFIHKPRRDALGRFRH